MHTSSKTIATQHNFGAGPSILPKEVFEEASRSVVNYNNTGLSILEIGHRTKTFGAVLDEAVHTLKELMQLDADHEVLFLHGGASTQFFQVPMNLLDEKASAAYTDTDIWGAKAIKEASINQVEFVEIHFTAEYIAAHICNNRYICIIKY